MVAGGLISYCYPAEIGFLYILSLPGVNLIGNTKKLPKVSACVCDLGRIHFHLRNALL